MGQVGGNYPYGNQGDYQNPNYQQPRYYQQPHSAYSNGYGYNNGYTQGQPQYGYGQQPQYTYRQPQPQAQPPVARQQAYVPSYPSIGTSATVLSSSTVTGNSGVQSTSSSNSNSEAPKTSSAGPGKELAAEAKAMQTEVAADNKSKKNEGTDGGGGDNASSEGMKAVSVLMTVIGVVTSMDMIAKALQLAGFVMKTVGTALDAAGTAMDAAGMAMIAAGNAMLSNPFTAIPGAILVSAGTAMKVAGNVMKVTGKVLKTVGNVLEKTGKLMDKALKALMRGAKNVARKGMNKFRKIKQMRAAKAAKAAKAKAVKLRGKPKNALKTKNQGKLKKVEAKQAKYEQKVKALQESRAKTKATIAEKQVKNQQEIAKLKKSVSSGWQQAKAAPGQATKRLQAGATKQTQNWKSALGKTSTTKDGAKAWPKPGEATSSAKNAWKKATTNSQGVNKFSASKLKVKQDWAATKADFKNGFRTAKNPKSAKAANAEKAGAKPSKFQSLKGKFSRTKGANAENTGAKMKAAKPEAVKGAKPEAAAKPPASAADDVKPTAISPKATEAEKTLATKCEAIIKKNPADRTPAEKMMLEHYKAIQKKPMTDIPASKTAVQGASKTTDDLAPGAAKSAKPEANTAKLTKEDLALDPKVANDVNRITSRPMQSDKQLLEKAGEQTPKDTLARMNKGSHTAEFQNPETAAKAAAQQTRHDWGKTMRWASGGVMIGVGAAGIQQAYGGSGDGTDPLQYHERFKTQQEFDAYYGFDKPFKPVDYHSGYYDPTLLPQGGSYYGNGGYNPFNGSTYYSRSSTPNQYPSQYPNQYPYGYQGGQGYNYGYNFSQYS